MRKLTEIAVEEAKIIGCLAEYTEAAVKLASDYSAGLACDLFGRCRLTATQAEEGFFALTEALTKYADLYYDASEQFLVLEADCDELLGCAYADHNEIAETDAIRLTARLHKKATVCAEIPESCFGTYLTRVHGLLVISGSLAEIEAGAIRREGSAFAVRLRRYTEKITGNEEI